MRRVATPEPDADRLATRVVEFNPATLATKQYIYVMDNPNLGGEPNTRADKIGDAVSFGNGEFLVLERDDDSVPDDSPDLIEKKIYRFNLAGATDVSNFSGMIGTTGKTVDQLTVDEMLAANWCSTPVMRLNSSRPRPTRQISTPRIPTTLLTTAVTTRAQSQRAL